MLWVNLKVRPAVSARLASPLVASRCKSCGGIIKQQGHPPALAPKTARFMDASSYHIENQMILMSPHSIVRAFAPLIGYDAILALSSAIRSYDG
jgi:hypothetical protein